MKKREKMIIDVRYIGGVNGDRVEVKVFNENNEVIRKETFSYGYNASYCRSHAACAEKDYNDSIKYNWTGYRLKPYIGDLLTGLFKEYEKTKEEVKYSGYYVFSNREATEEEVAEIIKNFYKEL